MAVESKTLASLPPGPSVSTIAGTLPFGLIALNAGVCCSPLLVSTGIGLVGQTRLLEEERDLRRVGRRMKIEADHGRLPRVCGNSWRNACWDRPVSRGIAF